MDKAALPKRVLIDTTVLIRALGERPNDPDTPDCRDFFDAMLAGGRTLLVEAPSISEMLRGQPKPALPNTTGILVVAFDDEAAITLGLQFPAATLKSLAASTGLSGTYLKYDALIAACALRHRAEHLVTVDRRLHPQVPPGLKVTQPGEFRARQGVLVEIPETAGTKPKGFE